MNRFPFGGICGFAALTIVSHKLFLYCYKNKQTKQMYSIPLSSIYCIGTSTISSIRGAIYQGHSEGAVEEGGH